MLCRPGSSEAVLSSQLGRIAAGRARGNIGTRPTRMGTRLHGMARRAEEIERNRGRFRKNLVGGTEISNLANVIVGWPINLPSIKRGRIKPMPPLRLENAVVLQVLTDRNRIAELTVMPAVLSTTIDRDALSLHGATTNQSLR